MYTVQCTVKFLKIITMTAFQSVAVPDSGLHFGRELVAVELGALHAISPGNTVTNNGLGSQEYRSIQGMGFILGISINPHPPLRLILFHDV